MRSLPHQGPERTAAVCYAVGWTQHSKGVQIIRAAAICNCCWVTIGRPGGGNSCIARPTLRFKAQLIFQRFTTFSPGYLSMPRKGDETLQQVFRQIHQEDRAVGALPRIHGEHA